MARQRLDNNNQRKLHRGSNSSYRVTLPISIIRELGWRDNQKVVIERRRNEIVIKDWKK